MSGRKPRNPLVLPMILRHRHQKFNDKRNLEENHQSEVDVAEELNSSSSEESEIAATENSNGENS